MLFLIVLVHEVENAVLVDDEGGVVDGGKADDVAEAGDGAVGGDDVHVFLS